jgi:tight adherence protein C
VIDALTLFWMAAVLFASIAVSQRSDRMVRLGIVALVQDAAEETHHSHGLLVRAGRTRIARRWSGRRVVRQRLELAGRPTSPEAFAGLQFLCASGGLGLSVVLAMFARPVVILLPLFGFAGLRLPEVGLARMAKRRQLRIALHVPDLVELLVATTEAGLNPVVAFGRSTNLVPGPLGEELRTTVNEIDLGLPWRAAMQGLAERTDVPSIRRLVAALSRSHRLGTSLSETLRTVADDLRADRRARAEELARRAPTKMLFPLVFLILPAFLLLTVGPVVLATIRSLR